MNSAKRNKDNSKVSLNQKVQRENVDPLWNVENQQLQAEAKANTRLRQQIEKQSYADSTVQTKIKDKITQLKQKAIQIAQNLESQKRKNIELQAIIRHVTKMRVQEKSIEVSHRDDMNFQSVDNLSRKIKKFEYDLQQMFAKLNDLTSKTKERKAEVDAYRTQRVIDSGIFLKIQKQIVQSEIQYKKLLIEKTRFEKQYSKNLQNYKKMKADIEKQHNVNLSKRQSHQKQQYHQQFYLNMPQIEHAIKFTQISQVQNKRKSHIGSRKNLSTYQAKKEQNHHLEVQYIVKKILMETGLNSAQTFIDYFNNIERINEDLFKQVNKDTDKITQIMKQINNIKLIKQKKTIKYYERQPQMTKVELKNKQSKQIETEISKIQVNSNKTMKQLHCFLKNIEIKHVSQLFGIKTNQQEGIQKLQQIFSQLQVKINPAISNYNEFKKDIERESVHQYKQQDKQQTIEELINRIKKMEQSEKLMMRQDFKKQYEKVIKSDNNSKLRVGKKKPTIQRKH